MDRKNSADQQQIPLESEPEKRLVNACEETTQGEGMNHIKGLE